MTENLQEINNVFENLIIGEFEEYVTRIKTKDPLLYAQNPPEWLTMKVEEQKVCITRSIFWSIHFQHFLLSELAFYYHGGRPNSSPEQDIMLTLRAELPVFFKMLQDEQLAEYVDDNGQLLPPSDDYNEQFRQLLNDQNLLFMWNHFLLKHVVGIWMLRGNFETE